MLTEREVKILSLLANSGKSISIKQLANMFGLSERSIRYDIDNINNILKEKKLPLIKRESEGKLLLKEKQIIINYLNSIDSFQYTPEIRRKLLLYEITLSGKINITSISKKLNTSRSTIKSDVDELKNIFNNFHLNLASNYKKGLLLVGKEEDIRKLQLKVFLDNSKMPKVDSVLFNPIIENFLNGLSDIKMIEDFIFNIQQGIGKIISDEAYNILKIYIMISVIRNKLNHTLKNIENASFLASTDEYMIIKKNKEILNKGFNINLNKYELLKIADLFLGSHSYNFSQSYYENWIEVEVLVKKLVENFSNKYGLDLTDDKELIKGLINHIKPTLYRTQNNIKLQEFPLYAEVIKAYPKIYEITSNILKDLENFIGKKFDNDEIAIIAIYFKVSIDRNKYKLKTNKNVLLVCGLGYGTSKLLEQQLKQQYELNVIDSIPLHYVKKYKKMNEVDVIITTIRDKFPEVNKPVLVVSPILTHEDIIKLDNNNLQRLKHKTRLSELLNIIKSDSKIEDYNNLIKKIKNHMGDSLIDDLVHPDRGILDLLPLENIRVNVAVLNWENALIEAGMLLTHNGYVKESYVQSLIKSFKNFGSYMIIAQGVAIPHAKNENNVLKTGMSLLILKNEVEAPDKRTLKIILAFASLDNTEHLEALTQFYNLVTNCNFKDKVSNMKHEEDILHFICNHIDTQ
ncbi:MAG TPA: hypothetical protein DD429_04650 [Clostridiaceae bacterium]|nr:hypothetical protein [Clostridiaceae bacterium]